MTDFEREARWAMPEAAVEAENYWGPLEDNDDATLIPDIPDKYFDDYLEWAKDVEYQKKRFASPEQRQIVYDRDEGACHYCHVALPFNRFQVDHKVPFSKQGNTELDNLVCSCYLCNRAKHTSSYEDFIAQLAEKGLAWRNQRAKAIAELYSGDL